MESRVYDDIYAHEDAFWWYRGMRKISKIILDKYVRGVDNNILDAGCGTGGMLDLLGRYGTVTGVDINPKAVLYANLRKKATILEGNLEKLPCKSASYDLVNCNDVLYHSSISDDKAVLREFARVLRRGGLLLLREPAFDWLQSHHDRMVWTKHRYTRKELIKKLEDNGFIVMKASYVNFFLFPVALVIRLLERPFPSCNDHTKSLFNVPYWLDRWLYYVLAAEAGLLPYINLPFGLSIVCLAKKL
ncbi:hypothetical protein A2661_00510 [Candidatus Giovannonibacteria bacterium RIFCSPHIGHO2_01_FULL_45_24]|uniref:Methyltransferase type 11 domain-containing protein n=1 Tax=Candidatus Giovannonibacteria bacterium RIFCSPLOWO2_01_FULL_46_32 TaxID=1798353 RepID=A0A1F5XGR5_9BACT|nr:MAG: hypothetical protein A2661_00510 [Candidatus Giovannonibacteria bacterium RIFCSPHIGHO2_01_FULL_45_24]OGF87059.1 MAG: hypothetical protein A3B19_01350 [Candidatus Giovannonibacteria bacterium RIFCSPLOWO2_01_FULL_46_32]